MAFIKTMTIDGFYSLEEAKRIYSVIEGLASNLRQDEFGKELKNFNMISDDADELFSKTLNKKLTVDMNNSGIFRVPELFIHFESFDTLQDWVFVVAIDNSTFNIFEHQCGAKHALHGHNYNYRNLLEWDLTVNYLLQPGQGIFFRPWLFHSFDQGLIQIFKLKENDNN